MIETVGNDSEVYKAENNEGIKYKSAQQRMLGSKHKSIQIFHSYMESTAVWGLLPKSASMTDWPASEKPSLCFRLPFSSPLRFKNKQRI